MEKRFEKHVRKVQQELSAQCVLRQPTEMRQQVLLSKSVYLSRFIKLASLDRMRNGPEMDDARKFLMTMVPHWKSNHKPFGFAEFLRSTQGTNQRDN
jgi:hypothetical protein